MLKMVSGFQFIIILFRDCKSEEETGFAEEQSVSNRFYQVRYKGFPMGGLFLSYISDDVGEPACRVQALAMGGRHDGGVFSFFHYLFYPTSGYTCVLDNFSKILI